MENYRSKSYRDGGRPGGPTSMHDLRSYSTSYGPNGVGQPPQQQMGKMKKGKSSVGSNSKNWSLISDPELQRKKRVAGYKAYAVEDKVKGTLRKSFKWVKDTYTHVVYGWKS
ncbi:Auxilin-related protein [Actinidia chinensis var. chinensis]|uniref:Auxilin-related protein n=2 Tax=Actinidia TaxID=3624 RepID=A0A2R6QFH3_ACTCC|nr:Auxilin-related protein [Actinidia chinensis var. chinensis]